MGGDGSLRLTAIEDAILLWQSASVPWNIQVDVSAPRLDPDRLRSAWNAALARHDLAARAVVEDGRGGVAWSSPRNAIDVGPIDVVACPDGTTVDRLRSDLLDRPIALDRPPLVRTVVARRPTDDLLLSSVNHVLCDGVGALRLLKSVAAAYTGEPDPPPARGTELARRALASPASTSLAGLGRRWESRVEAVRAATSTRERVASAGRPGRGGGVCLRSVPADRVAEARTARGAGFDDHLVAATHLTIDAWNRRAGGRPARVGVALGVNLRGPAWRDDVVINLAAFVSSLTDADQRTDPAGAIAAVATTTADRGSRARLVVDGARAAAALPRDGRRQALAKALPDLFDSIGVSNLGVVAQPPVFDAGHRPEVWISPPAVPSVGLAVLVLEVGGELQVSVRYRRERFDQAGADAFTDLLVEQLTNR